jgi:hypothetical protein
MGILETDKTPTVVSPAASRRKSGALNFGSLKPLDAASGTKNFGGYRDTTQQSPKAKVKVEDAMDSDADDEDEIKVEYDDEKEDDGKGLLSPEDAHRQGELAEGVRKIKVRRRVVGLQKMKVTNTTIAQAPTFRRTPGSSQPCLCIRCVRITTFRNSGPWHHHDRSLIFFPDRSKE